MKKAIVLCSMVIFSGCESDQAGTQDVLQLVQTEKLKTQIRQLQATVEAKKVETERLTAENTNQEALHLEQTAEL